MSKIENTSVREFWDQRALLGSLAGTNDFILTSIEHRFLINHIEKKSRVLDAGCGNGSILILWGCDDQYIPYSRQHECRQRIVDHGFIVNRQQLFAYRHSCRPQPCTFTACQNNSLPVFHKISIMAT